jgi:hypothetical protein
MAIPNKDLFMVGKQQRATRGVAKARRLHGVVIFGCLVFMIDLTFCITLLEQKSSMSRSQESIRDRGSGVRGQALGEPLSCPLIPDG